MSIYLGYIALAAAIFLFALLYGQKPGIKPQALDGLKTMLAGAFLISLWRTFATPITRGTIIFPEVFINLLITLLLLFIFIVFLLMFPKSPEDTDIRITALEKKIAEQPGQVRFAWDLAHIKLETYIDRNLQQGKLIFFAAIGTIALGFGMVAYGVLLAWSRPDTIKPSVIAAGSGILTEFIAVTFMSIYRSTMVQANAYMNVLERINSVGMAVQILDTIPDADAERKNATRASMTGLLLGVAPPRIDEIHSTRR